MRKVAFFLALALLTISCSKDDNSDSEPQISQTVKNIWNTLNGTYKGTYYYSSSSDKVWYTESITFKPFSTPKRIYPLITNDKGDIYAYGTVDIADTRFMDISGVSHCYYTITENYSGAIPVITFYQYDGDNITGGEDKRNIKDYSSSSFRMWNYGLSETENSHIYLKQ